MQTAGGCSLPGASKQGWLNCPPHPPSCSPGGFNAAPLPCSPCSATPLPPFAGQLRMPAVPDECPEAAKELMLQCLSVSPEARPTAQEAMQQLMQLQRTSPIVSQEVTAGRP